MSAAMVKKLIAVVLAGALMVGTVGQAFAAKPDSVTYVKQAKNASAWQVLGRINGTWD
jgi:hypothetical protein